MTVSLSASALITVLETLTENDLKWLIKSRKNAGEELKHVSYYFV